jgi:hypothetical protein
MKKTIITLSALMLLVASCGSPKSLQKATGSTEIEVPFQGKDYSSNKDVFRAKNVGKSPDLATAKKIALLNAKSEMASNINSLIKKVAEQYVNQRSVGNKQEYESKFEENVREVVDLTMKDVVVFAEKTFKELDGSYSYWVAIEMNKANLIEGISNKISKNEALKLDYDKMKFEQIFNEEMRKMENQ